MEQAVEELTPTTLFTMDRAAEEADRAGLYTAGSLLYLVSRALEREEDAPLLGLQESLHADAALRDQEDRLAGCVNDANTWAEQLGRIGFQTSLLTNGDATREGMLEAINGLVRSATAGDVLVLQCAGHGTQVDDLEGDETDDQKDEALCPVDFRSGALSQPPPAPLLRPAGGGGGGPLRARVGVGLPRVAGLLVVSGDPCNLCRPGPRLTRAVSARRRSA